MGLAVMASQDGSILHAGQQLVNQLHRMRFGGNLRFIRCQQRSSWNYADKQVGGRSRNSLTSSRLSHSGTQRLP